MLTAKETEVPVEDPVEEREEARTREDMMVMVAVVTKRRVWESVGKVKGRGFELSFGEEGGRRVEMKVRVI